MKDKAFLLWIHNRLEYEYNENPILDYMHKLLGIVDAIDPDADSEWTDKTKDVISEEIQRRREKEKKEATTADTAYVCPKCSTIAWSRCPPQDEKLLEPCSAIRAIKCKGCKLLFPLLKGNTIEAATRKYLDAMPIQQRINEMQEREGKEGKSDGSTAAYYELPPNASELQHLISYRDMNAQMGEIFRATYRYGMSSHSDKLRDAKKIKFYIEAEIARLELIRTSE